jgi:hypothetical protein
MMRYRTHWLAAVAFVCLPLAAVQAAPPEKLIPADSVLLVTINVKQLLDAPLLRKHAVPAAKDALKGADTVNQILTDLGFDPFNDLDRITFASPGGTEKDRGLIIVHGKFDVAKFKAHAEKTAGDTPDVLKIGKGGGGTIYEFALPKESTPLFVALLNKTTIVASPGKDYVVDAMKKSSGKEKDEIKDKNFQAVLERLDMKQSIAFAAVPSAFKGDLGPAAEYLKDIDAAGGGLSLTDDLKLEAVVTARTADDAEKLKDMVNQGINAGIGLLGIVGSKQKELDQVIDILKTVKATSKDKTVTLKVRIDGDVLEKLTNGLEN